MKLLPIKINNDIEYMVDFEHNKSVPNTFIISSKPEGNAICDFYLIGDGIKFHGPEKKSLYIESTEFRKFDNNQDKSVNLNVDYILTIKFVEQKTNNQLNPIISEVDGFRVDYVHKESSQEKINISGNIEDAKGIAIKFVNGTLSQHIVIYIAPEGQIRDAVIDSGSESSQIAIFKRDDEYSINNVFSIVNSAYRFFTQGRNQDKYEEMRKEIINSYQSESDDQSYDPKLFKSVFFAKKNITAAPKHVHIIEDEASDVEPILKLFSFKDEESIKLIQEKYVQLCNMKIASFTGIESPKIVYDGEEASITQFANSYCYRRYMNLFSYLILKNLCSATNQDDADEYNRAKLLSLYILMPNVFSAAKIQKYIDFIREDIMNLISNTNNFNKKIKGVSVIAVSESDASLIGTIQMQDKEFNDGNYMIIDAGKGTTDFSIVKLSKGNYFSNMRSGIIGASAAISYGLLLDLIQTYNDKNKLGYNNIKDYIYQVILGHSIDGAKRIQNSGDLFYIQQMLDTIDRYKIRYSGLMYDSSTGTNNNSNLQDVLPINEFTKWIRDYNYKVKGKYVNAIIKKMVDNILEKTKDRLNDVNYVILAGRGFKFKQFRDTLIETIKKVNSKIEFIDFDRNSSLTEKNVCLFIPDTIHKGKYKSYSSIYTMISDNKNNKNIPTRNSINNEHDYHFEDGGIFNGKKGKCKINGSVYELDVDITGGNIFCDANGQFVIRHDNNKVTKLKDINTIEDTSMAFPSLFPNWNINSQDVIYIPEIATNHGNDDDNNNNNDIKTDSYNRHDNPINQTNEIDYDRISKYYENFNYNNIK